jgi:hypothetical protein
LIDYIKIHGCIIRVSLVTMGYKIYILRFGKFYFLANYVLQKMEHSCRYSRMSLIDKIV